jgi:hypothetical protein
LNNYRTKRWIPLFSPIGWLPLLAIWLLSGCVTPDQGVARKTESVLHRQIVFNSSEGRINSITTIKEPQGLRIVIGVDRGAAFVTRNYALDRLIQFENVKMGKTVPVDVEDDGEYEFMDRGFGWAPVQLVSATGKLQWRFPKDKTGLAADQMAAGDIDGDGLLEFIVGMNASGGLYALEHDGSIKWRHEAGNVFAVEILDLNGDGHKEIVHVDRRKIVVRKEDGTPVRSFQFAANFMLNPFVWNLGGEIFIVGTRGESIYVYDTFGKEQPRVHLPKSKGYPNQVQPVRFGGKQYYASANKIPYKYDVGGLYIFDAQGELLYEEEFPARVGALTAVQNAQTPENEILLVGVGTQVIEYRMKMPE